MKYELKAVGRCRILSRQGSNRQCSILPNTYLESYCVRVCYAISHLIVVVCGVWWLLASVAGADTTIIGGETRVIDGDTLARGAGRTAR